MKRRSEMKLSEQLNMKLEIIDAFRDKTGAGKKPGEVYKQHFAEKFDRADFNEIVRAAAFLELFETLGHGADTRYYLTVIGDTWLKGAWEER